MHKTSISVSLEVSFQKIEQFTPLAISRDSFQAMMQHTTFDLKSQ